MSDDVHIKMATFGVAKARLAEMEDFYSGILGLEQSRAAGLRLVVGGSELDFEPHEGAPFYHFALLVPGNRFDAAQAWFAERVQLLTRPGDDRTTFEFGFWDARACYAHDPAGNIVELIAHSGIGMTEADGNDFHPTELREISEVGLVVEDTADVARSLDSSGIPLWFGEVGTMGDLGFAGRQAHTLILCPTRRPWLPTGRPAESHPVEVTLSTTMGIDVAVRLDESGTLAVSAESS